MSFIAQKARSRYQFGWILAPIIAYILLIIGEITGLTLLGSLPLPPDWTLFFELANFLFITLAIIAWAVFIEKCPLEGIGLAQKHAFRDFLLGWFFGGAFLTICVLLMVLFGGVQITGFHFSGINILQFIPLLLAWSIQGHAEEVLARGFLFSSVAVKNSIPVGIVVSSIFFSLIHLGNDGLSLIPILDLTLFGILAALYYLKTGSIWGISGAHAAWNCFQGNVFGFPVSGTDAGTAFISVKQQGPDWLSGGAFGVEGSLISVTAQALVIAWLSYDLFLRKK